MPLEIKHEEPTRIWGLWKIEEDEKALADVLISLEAVANEVSNPLKRLEFLAGRVLIKELLKQWSLPYTGLTKDEHGKPFMKDYPLHVSLTHSYPYVAAILDRELPVGIDLEQPKEKLLKIAARVLSPTELEDAQADVVKHCIYWCAKEALIKIYGKKDLILSKNLEISSFLRENQGHLVGRIIADNTSRTIPLHYFVYDKFVVVLTK